MVERELREEPASPEAAPDGARVILAFRVDHEPAAQPAGAGEFLARLTRVADRDGDSAPISPGASSHRESIAKALAAAEAWAWLDRLGRHELGKKLRELGRAQAEKPETFSVAVAAHLRTPPRSTA